ncbi:TPA: hypothetical protein ACXIGC_003240 [Stenotrophomonas maltophilia]|uniref:hypothetical protein n=1 Tax=Stenotrophomonas TaxID=40323 RepID=UPI00066BD06E|nr:hypothetical protein [Stenotrophomonas maltophilia]MBH1523987.1 hypothetical protein [Stenotrophomonas maltophilia]MBH1596835.1 hypothetical protein [Stenotrophomonas maltophilia]MBH1755058.1 hypothetical protein [Stenotrophomonas maltophilia]MBH1811924.1 hypothetical protein [Stenotrophomonas maltophilia]MBN5083317.1 hypothetical protein [Stenotrophomonas maltophilia]
MSEDLPVLWSPAQQAWLQAMGYTVYHDGQLAAELDAALQLSVAEAEAAAAPVRSEAPRPPLRESDASAERGPVRHERAVPPSRTPPVVAPDTAPAATRPQASGTARQPSVRLPDRLQIALLRASGCNPNDPATQALMDSWPLEQLRRDPAAKRALWPQLRALRKRGAP